MCGRQSLAGPSSGSLPLGGRVDVLTGITLAAPAGVNAYIPLLAVALAERFGWVHLREPFDLLGSWWFIALVVVLLAVELVADKVPAVDHANDAIQTFVRPAAGGLVAVASSGNGRVEPWLLLVAGVLIAGGVHAVKATARPVINAVTGGVGAPVVSTAEDIGAAGVSVMAFVLPLLTFLLVSAGMAFAVWAILRWRRRRADKRAQPEAP
jgi:hypothetical protein